MKKIAKNICIASLVGVTLVGGFKFVKFESRDDGLKVSKAYISKSERLADIPTENVNVTEVKDEELDYEQDINYEEAYLLAQLMFAENGIQEEDEALILTGVIALKRVKSPEFPDTLVDVIAQEGQYLCYENGSIMIEPDERCLELAEEILRYHMEEDYPDDLVFQSEFKQGSAVYARYGNQYFCLR